MLLLSLEVAPLARVHDGASLTAARRNRTALLERLETVRLLSVVLLLLCLAATGCGRGGDRERATEVADRFLQAVGSGDGAVACRLLADDTRAALEDEEQKPCPEAIGSAQVEAGSLTTVELYITNAKADLDNGESAFLSLTADGWRVSAAGCKRGDGPAAEAPMDCELEA